jgi:predicted deacylase
MERVCISDLTANPGEKKEGLLKIVSRAASSIFVPITIINGVKEGPTLTVIAGEHGCEYCGIEAAIRLCKDIEPAAIAGKLVVIPVANVPAFEAHSLFVCPIDGVNLYAAYPGSTDGSISYAMAYSLFNQVVLKSDYVVHLHGGDANEALIPFTYFAVVGNKRVDELSENLARHFPVDYVFPMKQPVKTEGRESAPEGTSYATSAAGTIYYEAAKRGVPATMLEAGRDGKIEEEFVKIHYDGILNVMRYLKMLKGKSVVNNEARVLKNAVLVSATKGGVFRSKVELGESISKGQVIGEVRNLYGDVVEEIKSPIDGLIVCKVNHAAAAPNPVSSQPYQYYIAQVDSS